MSNALLERPAPVARILRAVAAVLYRSEVDTLPVGNVVAIYARISKDRNALAENVETQIEHATAYAQDRWPGSQVVVYCDNDLSAADPNTFRPEYALLLADIAAGHVVQVVSADQERLTRQPSEWETLMPLLVAAGINETHGYRDGVTPVTMGKRSFGRFKALMAAEYVEGVKVKINEKLEKLAKNGRPSGATVYGYRHVEDDEGRKSLEVIPEQAVVVREVAGRLLAGEALSAVATDLNDRGLRGAKGGRFTAGTVRGMVTNNSVAGLRLHKGQTYPGTWTAIIGKADWTVLCARFLNRERTSPRPARRRHMLSGTAVCGCGTQMTGRNAGETTQYTCGKTKGGCGQTIDGDAVNALVEGQLLDRLDHLAAALGATDDHEARRSELVTALEAVEPERDQNSADYAAKLISRDTFLSLQRALDARCEALTAELASLPVQTDTVDPDAVRKAWAHLTDDEKRRMVARFVERVVIDQRRPGAQRRFDAGRIHIEGPGWDA